MTWKDYYDELAILKAGGYTGRHDENGNYAPHPPDFYLPDGTINPDRQGPDPDEITTHATRMADIVEHWYLTGETPF
ncbi:hypothetical protein GCM10027059_36040 [Myceligenerans halotolerans]